MSETSGKVWPCNEIKLQTFPETRWFWPAEVSQIIPKSWILCPVCGAKRPEEKDDLDEILSKHNVRILFAQNPKVPPTSDGEKLRLLLKDLRAWKEKDHIVDANKTMVEEEKPKRLWEILNLAHNPNFLEDKLTIQEYWQITKVALDWFEGILPKKSEGVMGFRNGWDACLAEIRHRLEKEKSNG